jgi:hypothetical protein
MFLADVAGLARFGEFAFHHELHVVELAANIDVGDLRAEFRAVVVVWLG